MSKIYEKCLILRLDKCDITINDMQGACRPGCSSLHTAMLLQESLAYNRDKNSTVYITLLDTKKSTPDYSGNYFMKGVI